MSERGHVFSVPLLACVLCLLIFASVGCRGKKDNRTVQILTTTNTNTYLLVSEVEAAPSGEMRIYKTGEYLDKDAWVSNTVFASRLSGMKHYGQ